MYKVPRGYPAQSVLGRLCCPKHSGRLRALRFQTPEFGDRGSRVARGTSLNMCSPPCHLFRVLLEAPLLPASPLCGSPWRPTFQRKD